MVGESYNETAGHESTGWFGGGHLSLEFHLLPHVQFIEWPADALGEDQRIIDQIYFQRLAIIFKREIQPDTRMLEAVPDLNELILEEHASTTDDILPLFLAECPDIGKP